VFRATHGSQMIDVDNNKYVDFSMGFGSLLSGHCHPLFVTAIENQLKSGRSLSHSFFSIESQSITVHTVEFSQHTCLEKKNLRKSSLLFFRCFLHKQVLNFVLFCFFFFSLGSLFTTASELHAEVAEQLVRRFPIDKVRFTNSGTEATHDAIRVARTFTGRDKINKVEGGKTWVEGGEKIEQ
jgi:4-aminobutyrate aminotransferase-like enzyme